MSKRTTAVSPRPEQAAALSQVLVTRAPAESRIVTRNGAGGRGEMLTTSASSHPMRVQASTTAGGVSAGPVLLHVDEETTAHASSHAVVRGKGI